MLRRCCQARGRQLLPLVVQHEDRTLTQGTAGQHHQAGARRTEGPLHGRVENQRSEDPWWDCWRHQPPVPSLHPWSTDCSRRVASAGYRSMLNNRLLITKKLHNYKMESGTRSPCTWNSSKTWCCRWKQLESHWTRPVRSRC